MTTRAPTSADIKSGTALLEMLSFKRPAGSKAERQFIQRFITPLGAKADAAGNYWLRIGEAPVMWSCHTDTVHDTGGRQRLIYTGPGILGIDPDCKSNCLGADDTAGVWLMHEMAQAKIPGLYLFHRSEENGCIGSRWIAKKRPEGLSGLKYAIALDRRGKTDVITHQGGRTCSDEFAKSLAAEIGMGYSPCKNGIFTDTASYPDLIGECTNLSVGYQGAHTASEKLDEQFLFELKEKMLHLNVSNLVASRNPGDPRESAYTYDYRNTGGYDYGGYYDEWGGGGQPHYHHSRGSNYGSNNRAVSVWQGRDNQQTILQIVKDAPHAVASLLEDFGYDAKTLKQDINKMLGIH